MANQSFRDVNTVVFGATAILGVQSVRLGDGGEGLDFHSDADAYRQDVGLTRQVATLEVERISNQKLRDVLSAVFTAAGGTGTGTAILGRVQRVSIQNSGKVIRDSGDADHWIRYLGLTEIVGQVVVDFRDQAQVQSAPLLKGRKGTLTAKVPVPRTGFGLPALTATETHRFLAMVSDIQKDAQHGEIGSARVTFDLYSSSMWTPSGVTGGKQLRPINLGWKGTVSWVAPAADASGGESTSVANALLAGIDVTLAHGEYSRATYRFEAHSSNGQTAPIT
jgi:hypothetical protein